MNVLTEGTRKVSCHIYFRSRWKFQGYRLAGGKILAINEFVEEARNTYRDNYPNTPILDGDIKELEGKDFLEIANIKEGELELLDGSPPCSAFSMCGTLAREGTVHSDGFGKTKSYSDGKIVTNIEDLFFEFLRVADKLDKDYYAENVEGLTVGEEQNNILIKYKIHLKTLDIK